MRQIRRRYPIRHICRLLLPQRYAGRGLFVIWQEGIVTKHPKARVVGSTTLHSYLSPAMPKKRLFCPPPHRRIQFGRAALRPLCPNPPSPSPSIFFSFSRLKGSQKGAPPNTSPPSSSPPWPWEKGRHRKYRTKSFSSPSETEAVGSMLRIFLYIVQVISVPKVSS